MRWHIVFLSPNRLVSREVANSDFSAINQSGYVPYMNAMNNAMATRLNHVSFIFVFAIYDGAFGIYKDS